MGKLVSVIVPVYNTEKYIKRCIDSILGQTYTNLELILINDGSTENEEEIILDYATRDGRVKYVKNEENIGLYKTRIKGVEYSTGEYISFVDSDDYISVDYIRLLVDKIEESNADMIYATTVIEIDKGGRYINSWQDIELNKLPLEGENLKRAYMDQAGRAYVWHTVWNKLYTRSLWLQCMPYIRKLNKHIVMTEDIAFSSVLYYYATKADRVENSIYYYCENKESSTAVKEVSLSSVRKKLEDIIGVFDHVESFYMDKSAYEKAQIRSFRNYYAAMWKKVIQDIANEADRVEANALVEKIGNPHDVENDGYTSYFVDGRIDYDNTLEDIKKRILSSSAEYISFDVFDTAVLRPFYTPSDIFYLLDKIYEENEDSTVSFHDIRIDAEIACRQQICQNTDKDREDISLDEIYSYIYQVYGVSGELCHKLKEEEITLELKYCEKRQAAYELYKVALQAGKRVIFISDMYLDRDIIKKILKECGYDKYDDIYVSSEYGQVKSTGKLYKIVMEKLDIENHMLIHIGDSLSADIEGSKKQGIDSIHIPRTIDLFEEKIGKKDNCSSGYGCLVAMVANKYFDNPYRYFHPMTTYNMDPFFMGYYALGMNLIAQLQWINENRENTGKVIFTSRDGYMMYRAYDIYNKYANTKICTSYKYISRRAMLPVMLMSRADFMKLPVQFDRATPDSICEMLEFCSKVFDKDELSNKVGIQWNKVFSDRAEYHGFMDIYMDNIYSKGAHYESIQLVKEYWKDIDNQDIIYDMGYTGSMHYGITKATDRYPKALFVHTDMDKYQIMSRKGDFVIDTLMPNIPPVSSILREYIFSSTEGTCIGYMTDEDIVKPNLCAVEHFYCDLWPLHMMQESALRLVEAFYDKFAPYMDYLSLRRSELVNPLEELLQVKTKLDIKVFSESYFDDISAGTGKLLSVKDYWLQVLLTLSDGSSGMLSDMEEFLKEKDKKGLAFWGTGKICEDILRTRNIKVDVFFDNNPLKAGLMWHNGVILNPTDILEMKKYYIIIACAAYAEVELQLQRLGLDKYKDYISYIDMF